MRTLVTVVAAMLATGGIAVAQDVEAGKKVFAQCRACHQIGPEAKNAVGPKLNGVIGRKAGSVEGFQYSDANKNSGVTWNEDTFRKYIVDPKKLIPGTKMIFPGLKKEADIENVLAFLKTFDAEGKEKK